MSYLGGLTMLGSAVLIIFFALAELVSERPNPYVGILTYLILPLFLFTGLLLLLWGMRRESVRRRRAGTTEAPAYPRVDLNEPAQRRRFTWILLGGGLVFMVVAFAAYNGFLFTESVTFCGQVCHTPMEPEYTTYLSSPHARVSCVECHVGSGASWYVKSKLSGVRQVFAVLFDTYKRPIPTPIEDLRPARETCEHCHWPEKFYGAQLLQRPHFRQDEKNTAEQVTMLLKTGGGRPGLGFSAGIHWHMIIENKVRFAALDRQLQKIAVVRVTRADGVEREYVHRDYGGTGAKTQPERLMDCMDCHNRPSHNIEPPGIAVDRALATGLIPRHLPWVKKVGMESLLGKYRSREEAREGIRRHLSEFYRARYPEVLSQGDDLEKAIKALVAIHERNVFPRMKVTWDTYPVNIGHKDWPGCFRCHNNRMVSKDGKVLTDDCTLCHTAPQRGPLAAPFEVPAVGTAARDWHPMELTGKHARLPCTRCHAAAAPAVPECAACHRIDPKAPMMTTMSCADCHLQAGSVVPLKPCAKCHPSPARLHTKPSHQAKPCGTCHKPHAWKVTGHETCLPCHRLPENLPPIRVTDW
jgi:hypothetical protein